MLKQYRLKNYHFQLVVYIIALSIIGILLIGSAKHSVQSKQIIGFVMGLTIMIVLSLIDYTFLLKFVWIYYAGMIVLLLLVLFAGDDAKGAQRWFEIAGIRFQPSEIAKIILILFFAYFFSARPIFLCLIFLLFLYFHNGNWGGCLFLLYEWCYMLMY